MNADQLAVAYASADVFLFPSAVETFGNVTLEAASSGLPVIVEAGCSGHLVGRGDDANGFACLEGDEESFFKATRELVTNEKLRVQYSHASRRLALSLEKRAVVRAMLDNYSHVTDQFFTEYSGHHANRDRLYRKPDSFVAGNHPRPLLLQWVEYLFIVLFQVIWNMTNVFMYMQEGFLSFGQHPDARFVSGENVLSSNPPSPSRRQHVAVDSAVLARSFGDGPNIVELTDIEMSSVDGGNSLATNSSMTDDETDAGSNSSLVDEATTRTMTAQSSSSAPPLVDCLLSHVVAKAFIRIVQNQCRLESHFRDTCSSCRKPAKRTVVIKRKNSSFALHDSTVLESRSRLSPGRAELPVLNSSTLDGNRLRRQRDPLAVMDAGVV
jgi:hypothetical protein